MNKQTLNAIESLLIGAHSLAIHNRLKRGVKPNTSDCVQFNCQLLDKHNVSFKIQNTALMFINNASECNKTWDLFYKQSKRSIAEKILNGTSYNELISNQ